MKLAVIGLLLCVACVVVIVAGVIVFGTKKPPAPLGSITNPFGQMDFAGLPAIQRYSARDGAQLSFRVYPALPEKQVAVLIHGSAGSSSDLHELAKALQTAGTTVYVPDLRGHGASQPHGDVAYTGQLDDDLADLLAFAKPQHPRAKWILLGFSSGGGFALRVAAGPQRDQFDRYILLSPFLRYDAPTVRAAKDKEGQSWSVASTGRIIGLTILDRFGIHQFDGLPVIHFAVPPNVASVTGSYSLRLQRSFQPHDDYMADIRAVSRPMQVLVGSEDGIFLPEKFQEVFSAARKDIPVSLLKGLGHSDMVTSPEGIRAAVTACAVEAK